MSAFSYYQAGYWALRAPVLGFGLLFTAISVYKLARIALLFSSGGKLSPTDWLNIPFNALILFFAIFFLLPHRWFLRTPLFVGKMLIYGGFMLFALYWVGKEAFDFVTEKTVFSNDGYYPAVAPLDIIFVFLLFIPLALLAPLTLLLKSRLSKTQAVR
jgi:hypothetical protein